MQQATIDKLEDDYDNLKFKGNESVVKYFYQYNNIHVNVYYDRFDIKLPNLSTILVYKKSYYYTSLNILNPRIKKQYLEDIPQEILSNILVNNELDDFFMTMEKNIINSDKVIGSSYKFDRVFNNTMQFKVKNSRNDLPFLQGLRHGNMSNEAFNRLQVTFGIEKDILRKVKDRGFTFVRTSDISRRKDLTLVLNKIGIQI